MDFAPSGVRAGRFLRLPLPSMEGGRPPSPGDELELSALKQQPDEQTPLNGAAQVIPFSAEDPGASQVRFPWR